MGSETRATGTAHESWRLLIVMVFAHRQSVMDAAVAEDLTPGHAIALMNLDPDEPRPMRELAGKLRCDASYLTGVVDRLESLGLVERRPAAADRRVKELLVTPDGSRARERLRAAWLDPPSALRSLPEGDGRALRRIMRRLVDGTDLSQVPGFLKPASDGN